MVLFCYLNANHTRLPMSSSISCETLDDYGITAEWVFISVNGIIKVTLELN